MSEEPTTLAPLPEDLRVEDAKSPFDRRIYTPGAGYVHHLTAAPVPELGGMNLSQLAGLATNRSHPLMQEIAGQCSQYDEQGNRCPAVVHGFRLFIESNRVACDECRRKAEKADAWARAKVYWESICPPSLRETDKGHAGFPRAIYESLKDYTGGESLLLFGPSGRGKTRVGALLLKRCLIRFSSHVGILWPEQLKSVKNSPNRLEMVEKWGRYDLLMMDDSLLTGAQDERVTDFLKDVLDYRMRHKRHQIITSQIGGAEYEAQADKFENVTAADLKRVQALLRRLREVCRVVSFAEAKPANPAESTF